MQDKPQLICIIVFLVTIQTEPSFILTSYKNWKVRQFILTRYHNYSFFFKSVFLYVAEFKVLPRTTFYFKTFSTTKTLVLPYNI